LTLRLVGISSSPRHGNTEYLIKVALEAASEAPIPVKTRLVSFVGKRIEPCSDCQICVKQKRGCIKHDDWQELVSAITEPVPDGIIIGSPVYFFDVNSQLRAFFERCTSLLKGWWVEGFPIRPPDFSRTACAAIAVGYHRHGGAEHAMASIIHWFLTMGGVCTGVDYIGGGAWQQHVNAPDAVEQDEIGMRNARATGRHVVYLAYLLSEGQRANQRQWREIVEFRNQELPMA